MLSYFSMKQRRVQMKNLNYSLKLFNEMILKIIILIWEFLEWLKKESIFLTAYN